MKKEVRNILSISLRYFALILVALPNLYIFYAVFTPLTIYPLYFLLSLFFDVSLKSNLLTINGFFSIEIIKACIAGSAYYLLSILILSIPNVKITKRIAMILFAFGSFLILNILRIIFLIFLYVAQFSFFEIIHLIFWYIISIIFVVGIWFTEVKIFKIKEIPFYSDIKYLISQKNN